MSNMDILWKCELFMVHGVGQQVVSFLTEDDLNRTQLTQSKTGSENVCFISRITIRNIQLSHEVCYQQYENSMNRLNLSLTHNSNLKVYPWI